MSDITLAPAYCAGNRITTVLWQLIALMAIGVGISFVVLQIRVDLASNPTLIVATVLYTAVIVCYARLRQSAEIVTGMISFGQLVLILLLGVLLTYAATAVAIPLRDAELYAIDNWLGFDRQRHLGFVSSTPALSTILDHAYLSIQPQTILVPLALLVTLHVERLQSFVLAFGLSLVATAVIAAFVPAVGAMIHVDLAPEGVSKLPSGTYTHFPTLEALRSGTLSTIRLNDLEGLITFPSFHTANGILFAWAVWVVRWLRVPGLALNALMIASTPTTGQHYLIDVLAGSAVAVLAIIIAGRIVRSAACNPTATPSP